MVDDVATVAAGLTKAQRAYLTDKAVWRWPAPGHAWRWMAFPPRSTHRVLCQLGLMDLVGQISPPGLSVRDHILKEQKG
jgi:hypothetical protein